MFCPKCGQQNPETGKFCRSCGTDLGNISEALSSQAAVKPPVVLNHKGKPISYESAIAKIFSGLAFIAVAIALAFTIGKGWWFWMLIPAFGSLGSGIAQWLQVRNAQKHQPYVEASGTDRAFASGTADQQLPGAQQQWTSDNSRYKTGDLVPPSVTDATTRHLELDSEGKTMTLPKE
jgi:hypothetical protein